MAICCAWRHAGIGRTALWSNFDIKDHDPSKATTNDGCQRFHYKTSVLETPVAVRKAIRRSRGPSNLSLDVKSSEFCRNYLTRCLDVVSGQPEQLGSINFNLQKNVRVNIGHILAASLSNLPLVRISSYSHGLVAALASHAPFLHTIEFTGDVPHNFTLYIDQVLRLGILKVHLGRAWHRELHNLVQRLPACTALHYLQLSDQYGVSVGVPLCPMCGRLICLISRD